MSRRRSAPLTDADRRLFRLAMRDVAPLDARSSSLEPPAKPSIGAQSPASAAAQPPAKPSAGPQSLPSPAAAPSRPSAGSPARSGSAQPPGAVEWRGGLKAPDAVPAEPETNAGRAPVNVDRRTAQRFQRGQMEIEGRIDLHGHSVARAREVLTAFLLRARSQGLRCVLVITGKGMIASTRHSDDDEPRRGLIRQAMPGWLKEAPLAGIVLGATPARARDGGQGAWYILLRRAGRG